MMILIRYPSLQGTVLSAGAPYKAMFKLAGCFHNSVIFWNDSPCSGGNTGRGPRELKHLFFFRTNIYKLNTTFFII